MKISQSVASYLTLSQGNTQFKQGQYEVAVESYTKAIELDPLSAVMPANRAMALIKLERSEYTTVEQYSLTHTCTHTHTHTHTHTRTKIG